MASHDLHQHNGPVAGQRSGSTDQLDQFDHPEQLSLFSRPDVPVQFRLDSRTCERGRAHIAAIRQQLEAQAARRRELDSAA
jgi:hypothetical protein